MKVGKEVRKVGKEVKKVGKEMEGIGGGEGKEWKLSFTSIYPLR